MWPALVVTYSRSRTPEAVATLCSSTGAPSAAAGSATRKLSVSEETLLRSSAVSSVLLPLCAGSPLN